MSPQPWRPILQVKTQQQETTYKGIMTIQRNKDCPCSLEEKDGAYRKYPGGQVPNQFLSSVWSRPINFLDCLSSLVPEATHKGNKAPDSGCTSWTDQSIEVLRCTRECYTAESSMLWPCFSISPLTSPTRMCSFPFNFLFIQN